MLKIRLARAGKRNMAFFRVVLTEHTAASKHGYKEVLGFYNPMTKEFRLKDLEKIAKYLSQGVQFSPRIEKLVKTNNIEIPTVK
jgi:small subunit ribosomal protein S16